MPLLKATGQISGFLQVSSRIFSAATMVITRLRTIFLRNLLRWPKKMVLRPVLITVGAEKRALDQKNRDLELIAKALRSSYVRSETAPNAKLL